MLNKVVPKEVLQTLLGHRSIKTTEIYANWIRKEELKRWVTELSPSLHQLLNELAEYYLKGPEMEFYIKRGAIPMSIIYVAIRKLIGECFRNHNQLCVPICHIFDYI